MPSTASFLAAPLACAVLVSFWSMRPWWAAVGLTLSLAVAAAAAVVDGRTGRIPDRLVVAASVPTVVVLAALASGGDDGATVDSLLGLGALALPLLVLHVASPASLGFGDVKLAASLGATIGVIDPRSAVLALLFASGITLAFAWSGQRSTLPFGPGLVAGVVLAVVITSIEGLLPWR